MKNTIIFVLVLILLLLGCKRVGQDKVGADPEFEVSNYPDGLLDSLMWAQYHCPEGEDEMIYKWNWAYDVCDSLGIYELESLDSLTHQLEEDLYDGRSCIRSSITIITNQVIFDQ